MENCKNCNKQFESCGEHRVFCSKECFQVFYQENSKDYKNDWRKKNPKCEKDYTKDGNRCFGNILSRCNNPNFISYPDYGARGIRCLISREEFLKFYLSSDICNHCGCKLDDINRKSAKGRNVDRINSNGHYEISNLRLLCKSCNSWFAKMRKSSGK